MWVRADSSWAASAHRGAARCTGVGDAQALHGPALLCSSLKLVHVQRGAAHSAQPLGWVIEQNAQHNLDFHPASSCWGGRAIHACSRAPAAVIGFSIFREALWPAQHCSTLTPPTHLLELKPNPLQQSCYSPELRRMASPLSQCQGNVTATSPPSLHRPSPPTIPRVQAAGLGTGHVPCPGLRAGCRHRRGSTIQHQQ